jgi:selenocysteine lyase/cysteine desulfurase
MGNEACWRDEFPVVKEMAFFNHSAVSPLPRRARDAGMAVFDDRWLRASMDYFRWLDVVRDARERAARLLGTAPAQVAFTGNPSAGLASGAAGLPWREGDRVAVTWPDFPTLRFPFDALAGRGVRLVEIPRREGRIDLDEAATRIPGCRLVVASTVDWTTGAALDVAGLAALCRREGALLCLDAIQSLGVLSLDVTALGVDFVAAGCHKLQLGPMGLGIFYVAPGREELLAPVMVGWRSMEDEEHLGNTYRLKTGAGRFEAGTQDVAAIAAYGASLSLLEEVGLPACGSGSSRSRTGFARAFSIAVSRSSRPRDRRSGPPSCPCPSRSGGGVPLFHGTRGDGLAPGRGHPAVAAFLQQCHGRGPLFRASRRLPSSLAKRLTRSFQGGVVQEGSGSLLAAGGVSLFPI